MARSRAQSIEAVSAQLETMSAPAVAALAEHAELLKILGDALVPVTAPQRAARPFGGKPRRPPLSEEAATRRLDARTRPATAGDMLGTEAVARLLGLGSRQAVHVRLRQGALLGMRGAKHGLLFPREQFVGDGQVVDGLAELQRLLGAGQATWAWLDGPCDTLDGRRPVELLREGIVEPVLAAALSVSQGDFD